MTDAELSARFDRLELILLDPDLFRLQRLFPQIAAQVEERFFRITDLEGIDFGGLTPAQVGLLFSRNTHRAIGEFQIVALRRNREGRQYQLVSLRRRRRG